MQNHARPRQTIPTPTPAELAQHIATTAAKIARQRVAAGLAADLAAEEARLKAELEANPPDPEKVEKKRGRKKKKKKPRSDTPTTALQWLQQAARVLTERRIAAGENIDFGQAYALSLLELRLGYFNPEHWEKCEQLDEKHFQNVPETGPDPKERSYAYPDPSNVRTLATYGDGSETTGPPRYHGNKLEGHFVDRLLVWKRATFEYVNKFDPGAVEPTFIDFEGTVTAFADRRGSGPMLSYIAKTWSVKKESSRLTTTEPPTNKPWSFYYRFKVPQTPPPFYHAQDAKKHIRTMRQPKHEETDGRLEKAVVLVAPRPMYGRGFNNNINVTTQFNPTITIWQIKPFGSDPPPTRYAHIFTYAIQTRAVFEQLDPGLFEFFNGGWIRPPVAVYHREVKGDVINLTTQATYIRNFSLGGVNVLCDQSGEGRRSVADIAAALPASYVARYRGITGAQWTVDTFTHGGPDWTFKDSSYRFDSSVSENGTKAWKQKYDREIGVQGASSNFFIYDGIDNTCKDSGILIYDGSQTMEKLLRKLGYTHFVYGSGTYLQSPPFFVVPLYF